MKQKIILISICIAVVILVFTSIYSGWYIQFRGDKCGRDYNKERIEWNQPIIEDYFVKKSLTDKQSNSWVDTTESHLHLEKLYYTNLLGELMYESDSYKPSIDSTRLKSKLDIHELSKLDYWRFTRLFYPRKGVDSYYFLFRLRGGTYKTSTLNMHEGDSLYQTFKLAHQ
ncbi:MAG: hypothetical protein OJF59_003255 [Cytophagales bacterium]|jgi:hypothetical protein|nr:MAG: hypothetical protein OJF59_003255 [Cytophagales bacterium]